MELRKICLDEVSLAAVTTHEGMHSESTDENHITASKNSRLRITMKVDHGSPWEMHEVHRTDGYEKTKSISLPPSPTQNASCLMHRGNKTE